MRNLKTTYSRRYEEEDAAVLQEVRTSCMLLLAWLVQCTCPTLAQLRCELTRASWSRWAFWLVWISA